MEFLDSLEVAIKRTLPPHWIASYEEVLKQQHPNTADFYLMNPFHVVLIILGYFLMVTVGIKIMQNKPRYEMKTFSLVHNLFLILLSTYMVIEIVRQAILLNYSLFGNALDIAPKGIGMAKILWIFYFSKTLEFIDTGIMILKKNFHQVTFLHVYHHATIFFIWWVTVYFVAGADAYFSAAQNSLVHILMYGYYLLSSLGIEVRFKKYITVFQMVQFAINMLYAGADVVLDTAFPSRYATMLFWYMVTLLALFLNFFIQSNRKVEHKHKKAQ